jgi:hypothetical protein
VIALAVSRPLDAYPRSRRALIVAPLILVGNVVIFLPMFGRIKVGVRSSSLGDSTASEERK